MATNLNKAKEDALQALLKSLNPDGPSKFSSDQVSQLSETLGQLVSGSGQSQDRNENGELLNEEGLPIIDITEPAVDDIRIPAPPLPADVVPIASLPDAERERKKRERDRILDQLEREEGLEESRQDEKDATGRREKRSEAVQDKFDLEKLRAAREMQKKMGKALLKNMAAARDKEEETAAAITIVQPRRNSLKPKKSVTFAGLSSDDEESSARTASNGRSQEDGLDWGDVMPGRIKPKSRDEPISRAAMARHPMRLDVVERTPRVNSASPTLNVDERDSDDESVPGSPVAADSDEGDIIFSDREEDCLPTPRPKGNRDSPSDTEDDEGLPGDHELEDEFDLDLARHQREVALEYYGKRQSIGQETAKAMTSHTHENGDEWDQPEVPLDATLSAPHPKPSMSRFKASRLASSFATEAGTSTHTGQSSTSLCPTVLSESGSKTLQRAIRTGKLEDEKLVSAQESEGEDDETMQEVLELLRKGEVYNIGPDGEYVSSPAKEPVKPEAAAILTKPKVSRFRANRPPAPTTPDMDSGAATPVSNVGRSSPKLPAPPGPDKISSVLERKPPTPRVLSSSPLATKPIVVGSPSFPNPRAVGLSFSASEPPSFIAPKAPPKMPSNVVESPSFPQGGSAATRSGSSRPQQPPSIMSLGVRESSARSGNKRQEVDEIEAPKKMSRFMAGRM